MRHLRTKLGLSARGQITVNKPVTATARATMNIQSGGLMYARGASLTFWDVASSLTINGDRYTLIGDLDIQLR